MKKTCSLSITLFLFVLVSITTLPGCSKYTITTSQKNPADLVYKKYTAASYFWGIINKPAAVIDTSCGRGGLSEVKVTTNIGYSLIHVATLGIVHLIRIECKCQKEPPIIGDHP